MTSLSPDDEMSNPELAPQRMIDGGASEHERSLVASARLDRVPSAAKARVAAALGGVLEQPAVRVTQPSTADENAHGHGLAPLGSRAGIGSLGAGMVGAIVLSVWIGMTLEPAAVPQLPQANTPAQPREPAPAQVIPGPTSFVAATPAASNPEVSSGKSPKKPKVSSRSSRDTHEARAGSDLLAEARALEAVRSALASDKVDVAARALEAYRRRFERGELAIEAEVLAIQIALARGKRDVASAAADRLLARPEAQHYRERVNALLERSNDPAAHMRARR